MNPISLSHDLFHSNQRQLLQATPNLPPLIGSAASIVVANALLDFTAVCDRIRLASSTLGAPTYFSFPSAVVYARNFYTRTAVTVLETPQFMYQGVSCSSVSVQLQSKMPPDPKLDYHRSSICVSVSTKDFTPATLTVGGTIGITKIRYALGLISQYFTLIFPSNSQRSTSTCIIFTFVCSSSCSIMYKVYHGAYDRSKGLIETTVSLSFFTFSSVWARTKENKGKFDKLVIFRLYTHLLFFQQCASTIKDPQTAFHLTELIPHLSCFQTGLQQMCAEFQNQNPCLQSQTIELCASSSFQQHQSSHTAGSLVYFKKL